MILLYVLAGLVAIVLIFGLLNKTGKATLTKQEVATHIEHFIEASDSRWEWDDFTSVPIKDPGLDRTRRRCMELETAPPYVEPLEHWDEAGKQEMRQTVAELRRTIAAERKAVAQLARDLYEKRIDYKMTTIVQIRTKLRTVIVLSWTALFATCGCRPGVSGSDARLIHDVAARYGGGPPAVGIGGHVEWMLGDDSELEGEFNHWVALRKEDSDELQRQIDSISNRGKLPALKELLHTIVSKDERASVIRYQFILTLTRLDRANRANDRQTVDSLLALYRNLFSEHNRLCYECIAAVTDYNTRAAELSLPDMLSRVNFSPKVTHQDVVDWFYVMDDSTKQLLLKL